MFLFMHASVSSAFGFYQTIKHGTWLASGSRAYFWFKQYPEPFNEFSYVLGLYQNLAWTSDLRDQAFAAEEGLFPSSKLLDLILA